MNYLHFLSISAVPGKPQNLTGTVEGSDIALSWQAPPPRDQNGDITAYKISWSSPFTQSEMVNVMVEAKEMRRDEWDYTILDVRSGVMYTVEVAVSNEAGTGKSTTVEVDIPPTPTPSSGTCKVCRACLFHP